MGILLVAVPGAVLSEPSFTASNASPEVALRNNRVLLRTWKEDPVHAARLQHDLREFWSLPETERARIRKLDHELHQLDPDEQKELLLVLERYHAWLNRLPDAQRRRIEQATTNAERLKRIRAIREEQWLARLPGAVKARIDKLTGQARKEAIARVREDERDWQQSWWLKARPTRLTELPREVQQFVRESLNPLLPPEKRRELTEAEKKPWPTYLRLLYATANSVTIPMPGPVPAVYIEDLPGRLKALLRRRQDVARRLKANEGKWPQFAVILRDEYPQTAKVYLNRKYTPSRPEEFSKLIQRFIQKDLLKRATPIERQMLKRSEGEWPRYPLTVQRLANRYRLSIPGTYLPGPKDLWKQIRQDALRDKK